MIVCRSCNLWQPLSAFTASRFASRVCKSCRAKQNAKHYAGVVKGRRTGASVGAMKNREKLEQAIARVELGDSPGYAAWRVGVDVKALERELERRGAA